jgi:hypothetical protein
MMTNFERGHKFCMTRDIPDFVISDMGNPKSKVQSCWCEC